MVRDQCFHSLHDVMSLHGVRHNALNTTLSQLDEMTNQLLSVGDADARQLAGILWRLQCSLAQLSTAVPE